MAHADKTRITLTLNNTPLYDILQYVGNLVGAKFEIEPHAIIFSPAAYSLSENDTMKSDRTKGLRGRILSVNPGWNFTVIDIGEKQGATLGAELIVLRDEQPIGKIKISSVEANQSIADLLVSSMTTGKKVEAGDTVVYSASDNTSSDVLVKEWGISENLSAKMREGAKIYLEKAGVKFPARTMALIIARKIKPKILIARNTQGNLDAIERIIKPHIVEKPAVTKSTAPLNFKEKVNALILPRIDFKDATLKEILSFLETNSKQLDPEQKGIKIVLKDPKSEQGDSKITLSLSNVPMLEALRYVTNLTNTKFKIGKNDTISILPRGTPDELLTKEIKIRPDLIPRSTLSTPAAKAAVMDARDFLIASGITFPEGSSAFYDPETSVLKITNTEENLDLLLPMQESTDDAVNREEPTKPDSTKKP